MPKIHLFFAKRKHGGREIDLVKAKHHRENGTVVVSGFDEFDDAKRKWHKGIESRPFGGRLLFEKLFQLVKLPDNKSVSDVMRGANKGKANDLDRLASQIGKVYDHLTLSLFGLFAEGDEDTELLLERLNQIFKYSRGNKTKAKVEIKAQALVSQICFYRDGAELPEERAAYQQLLKDLGYDITYIENLLDKPTPKIKLAEFGPYLSLFRKLEKGKDSASIAWKFTTAHGTARKFDTAERIGLLESGQRLPDCPWPESVTLEDAAEFCQGYGATRILADWLIPDAINQPVQLDTSDSVQHVNFPWQSRNVENGCEYLTPRSRLVGTDAAILLCKLDGTGIDMQADDSSTHPKRQRTALTTDSAPKFASSDPHYHPGDEITIVLDGEVDFHIRSTGIVQRMGPLDLIHFEAEHPHVVMNPAKGNATMLSIRVLRLLGHSARRLFWGILDEASLDLEYLDRDLPGQIPDHEMGAVRGVLIKHYPSNADRARLRSRLSQVRKIAKWLLKMRKPAHPLSSSPGMVVDFECLHRRIIGFLKYQGRSTDPDKFRDEPILQQLLTGNWETLEIAVPYLGTISEKLDIPLVLLYDSLVPPVQGVSIIRWHHDWIEAPKPGGSNSRYRLPARKLLGADVDICRLHLEPGDKSPPNDHPGYELIYCIEGKVTIQMFKPTESTEGKTDQPLTPMPPIEVSRRQLCHFDSTIRHVVENTGRTSATLIIIRFLDTDLLPFFDSHH